MYCLNPVEKIYGKPCTKFSKLSYKRKNFYDFPTTKLFANFRNFDIFPLIKKIVTNDFGFIFFTLRTTYKKPCIKFSRFSGQPKNFYLFELQPYKKIDSVENWIFVKIPVFPSFFFFVFLDFFENCWKMFTFYLYNAPRIFTFTSDTTPIIWNWSIISTSYAVHRHKKKKNIYHCKINTFITSFKI
ncbi:hypothetical protein AGLY_016342 [Aphis glycines]|uniref:Uncharacterized protein n=1 Tax=Aphis glycines TaxID=307491 RepID=A0A6G0SYA7_APHGL|nr:hypothetical protein AGLY_016342 [Aphis glycines]